MNVKHIYRVKNFKAVLFLSLALLVSLSCNSQTPVANRVIAMENKLPASVRVVAKYTDDKRHCLYYIRHNRLFKYDVFNDKSVNVSFSSNGYSHIDGTFLSPDGNCMFLVVYTGSSADDCFDTQELWRVDSRTFRSSKIGSGFKIENRKKEIIIRKVFRCLNPKAPAARRKWMAKDHYYDMYGYINRATDEYEITINVGKKEKCPLHPQPKH